MPGERVLVVGAGVAGSILAFWLAKYDYQVVVIERSKSEQKLGQGIEIEEPALQVMREMDIMDRLHEKKTGEEGFRLVDERSRSWALFSVGGVSPTGALEMMRGDLTEVLYKAADESANVTYHFETTIQSLRQTGETVTVDLKNRHDDSTWTEEFDMVIGADGSNSKTRRLLLGAPEEIGCFKPVGAYNAYFSIPKEEGHWPYSRLCHFPGRRVVWTRPTGKDANVTSVFLIHVNDNVPAIRAANASGDRMKQKEAFAELYRGLGWETPRILEHMMKTENFYSDELVQVKLPKWSKGSVALVGDAAWAPTPFTGQGNQLAIIGAWVLAQEMSRNRSPVAFEVYEKRLRSYVESSQNIPLGGRAPRVFVPETTWGIWILRHLFNVASWTARFVMWTKLPSLLPDQPHDDFDLQVSKPDSLT